MSIVYVGMDVHKNSHTLAGFIPETNRELKPVKVAPEPENILKYLASLRKQLGPDTEFECGYEAGCLGYTLQRYLEGNGVKCVIVAPSTIPTAPTSKKKKNDRRDAVTIARNLAFKSCSTVYVPSKEDEAVRDYIRMRDDHQAALKKIKQQIHAFCLRKGARYTEGRSAWTIRHINWLRKLELDLLDQDTLNEYLLQYDYLTEKIARLDKRIEELSGQEKYSKNVRKLECFLGIKTYAALALVTEVGDFSRFATAGQFASAMGLTPSEDSSGDKQRNGCITKAGNTHLRKILTEAANAAYTRGQPGHKSATLKKRQEGNVPSDIAYADRANERLRRKYRKMVLHGKPANVATTACARELSCYIWGMITGHTEAVA